MCIIEKKPRECLLKTRYFCFLSCLYVLYAGCLAVKLRSQYPHVPRSLLAKHFVVDKTPVLMTQMFCLKMRSPLAQTSIRVFATS